MKTLLLCTFLSLLFPLSLQQTDYCVDESTNQIRQWTCGGITVDQTTDNTNVYGHCVAVTGSLPSGSPCLQYDYTNMGGCAPVTLGFKPINLDIFTATAFQTFQSNAASVYQNCLTTAVSNNVNSECCDYYYNNDFEANPSAFLFQYCNTTQCFCLRPCTNATSSTSKITVQTPVGSYPECYSDCITCNNPYASEYQPYSGALTGSHTETYCTQYYVTTNSPDNVESPVLAESGDTQCCAYWAESNIPGVSNSFTPPSFSSSPFPPNSNEVTSAAGKVTHWLQL